MVWKSLGWIPQLALRTFSKGNICVINKNSTFGQKVHLVFLITAWFGAAGVGIILEKFLQSHETQAEVGVI